MRIREQVPLAPLTTLQVGGPARFFAEAASEDDVRRGVEFAQSEYLPLFVLGGGSNLLVSDSGFDGLVLKVALRGTERQLLGPDKVLYDVAAGEDWDALVAQTVGANCAGIECLSGIPGTVGGTPVQNVGAYGQEVATSITQVRVLDTKSLDVSALSVQECCFGYRTSRFNGTDRGRYVVLRVSFELIKDGAPTLKYADVQQYFAPGRPEPTLAEVRAAVLEIRRRKAMLIVADDESSRSAGSFFKNPVVTPAQRRTIEQAVSGRESVPCYPAEGGMWKLSAAWLVEHAGYRRGYRCGPVGTSPLHALAIVNLGGAKAADVIALQSEIKRAVLQRFGIELQPEPVFLGFNHASWR